jgi:hypothetical protein
MPAMKTLKKITEKATGWARPAPDSLDTLLCARKPQTFRFKDDGNIPQSSALAHGSLPRRGPARQTIRSRFRVRGAL